MNDTFQYYIQIQELISANGWEKELVVEADAQQGKVTIRLPATHRVEPSGLVGDYYDGVHSLEQIQQECLRALRTGRTGV